ncbi:tRNA preQ1(34) S-adenosylmethionine ribosyltransferase-isomerase QueA [Lujinxingia litoralis]|uniref:S-adenosylmethionine:tRNA ribosyltransferase-isomerase n=1 Tax=Lujinxingia litoralis TaxID=2211119 RepID=A0A328C8I4_9DELT|nr:tRNA preQ1(34) S-adenosylmethionine ribosyltransferase-isomerase QueA [Lujinxingia litoralis]RAL23656.1 tRNA preQ1(34) S-adenosylmethionine ribosyltransferase-isomerase QueA [Lujinxingia litoralis]
MSEDAKITDQGDDIWTHQTDTIDLNSVHAYDYALPPELIAATPAPRREEARLLVSRRGEKDIEHTRFKHLTEHLRAGDLLIFNDTRVVPARLEAFKDTGGRVELFVLDVEEPSEQERWTRPATGLLRLRCMTRSSKALRPGMVLTVTRGSDTWPVTLSEAGGGRALVELSWEANALAFLERFGRIPLPPYIEQRRREADDAIEVDDAVRYQTVLASEPGAVAAPTAGLHFSEELLARLEAMGVGRATLTLTVGAGTFKPVTSERLEDHPMHAEAYRIPEGLRERIAACKAAGGRVIAVGTTSARALEAEARRETPLSPGWRETSIFIRPGDSFQMCDGLITNFHLPRSTLLALVATFVGYPTLRRIYSQAVARGYRFYSYGDSSLLL